MTQSARGSAVQTTNIACTVEYLLAIMSGCFSIEIFLIIPDDNKIFYINPFVDLEEAQNGCVILAFLSNRTFKLYDGGNKNNCKIAAERCKIAACDKLLFSSAEERKDEQSRAHPLDDLIGDLSMQNEELASALVDIKNDPAKIKGPSYELNKDDILSKIRQIKRNSDGSTDPKEVMTVLVDYAVFLVNFTEYSIILKESLETKTIKLWLEISGKIRIDWFEYLNAIRCVVIAKRFPGSEITAHAKNAHQTLLHRSNTKNNLMLWCQLNKKHQVQEIKKWTSFKRELTKLTLTR
jgi:hypothetical protein